jgi:putative transposase
MTNDSLPLAEVPAKTSDVEFLRAAADAGVPLVIDARVAGQIGRPQNQRSAERLKHRSGLRIRALDTRPGSLAFSIPKPRQASSFQPFLEPHRTAEQAVVTVIQEAWAGGVCNRRVDELIQATGLWGISKSHPRPGEPWPPQELLFSLQ